MSGAQAGSLRDGELVFLHDQKGRVYRVRLQAGARFSIHSGALEHDLLIGRPEGTVVRTQLGGRLLALRPTLAEQVTQRRRQTQPIYPKDLAVIAMRSDLHPGATVVEAGTGTGALTMVALRAVGAEGRVVSYEAREDFQAAARQAIEEVMGGLPANLELKLGDAYQGFDEVGADRVLLDLPEPWLVVPSLPRTLRTGGIVFAHCPNVSQVQRFSDALREQGGFGLIESLEILERGWTVRGRSMRPSHRMVAHTGFLTFARRLAGDDVFETEGEGFR